MSGGEQQMLAIGRALMARPKLLLLDEPSMGIAPILVERIYETIAEINQQGTTILLVEQNANFALGVSQRGYVLETGKVALSNESAKLREDPEVQKAYLGRDRPCLAVIGVSALYLLYGWLAVGDRRLVPVGAQGLRRAPGPGVRAAPPGHRRRSSGCSCPAKPESDWKVLGPFGRQSPTDAPVDRGVRVRRGRAVLAERRRAAPRRGRGAGSA